MKRVEIIFILLLVLILVDSLMLFAQPDNKKLEISGQIRMRSEGDDRDFNTDAEGYSYSYLRNRVNVKGMYSDKVIGFIQLQDSRLFGAEDTTGATSTLKNTSNVDMRLGYVQVNRIFWKWLNYKFGRMEFVYGAERLLGSNPWSNVSRSFDGSVLSLNFDRAQIDLINVTLYESNIAADTTNGDNALTGIWANFKLSENKSLDFYVLNDNDQEINADDKIKLQRITLGSHFKGKIGKFDVETEFDFQTGKMNYTRDISAFYFTSAIGYTFPVFLKPGVTVGYDYISGDKSDTEEYECFNTLYPANHRFWGYMDYFKDMPKNTRNLGVNDLMVKTKFKLHKNLSLKIDGHYFQLSESAVLKNDSMSSNLGSEVDLTLDFDYCESVQFKLGGSFFVPGDVFKEWKGEDPAFWGFSQVTMNF